MGTGAHETQAERDGRKYHRSRTAGRFYPEWLPRVLFRSSDGSVGSVIGVRRGDCGGGARRLRRSAASAAGVGHAGRPRVRAAGHPRVWAAGLVQVGLSRVASCGRWCAVAGVGGRGWRAAVGGLRRRTSAASGAMWIGIDGLVD
jgi:hypothetical protein